jgi:hypothetical protein
MLQPSVISHNLSFLFMTEIVIRTRIRSSIKQAEELRRDLQHYEKKVKGLDDNEAYMASKGKELTTKAKERLIRNHEKLDVARQEFDKYATGVCHLIDSALDLAWMDMSPLVYRLACMEADRLGGESFRNDLVTLVSKLQEHTVEHNIDTSMPEMVAKKVPKAKK